MKITKSDIEKLLNDCIALDKTPVDALLSRQETLADGTVITLRAIMEKLIGKSLPVLSQEFEGFLQGLNNLNTNNAEIISKLFLEREECNEALANHETVQVVFDNYVTNKNFVGFTGIINGLLGSSKTGYGYLTLEIDENGKLIKFIQHPKTV